MSTEKWLKCKVSPGMFPNEYAVQSETFNGTGFCLFVGVGSVEVSQAPDSGRDVDGKLRVGVLSQEEDLVLVKLPAAALENGKFVTVKEKQLVGS